MRVNYRGNAATVLEGMGSRVAIRLDGSENVIWAHRRDLEVVDAPELGVFDIEVDRRGEVTTITVDPYGDASVRIVLKSRAEALALIARIANA